MKKRDKIVTKATVKRPGLSAIPESDLDPEMRQKIKIMWRNRIKRAKSRKKSKEKKRK